MAEETFDLTACLERVRQRDQVAARELVDHLYPLVIRRRVLASVQLLGSATLDLAASPTNGLARPALGAKPPSALTNLPVVLPADGPSVPPRKPAPPQMGDQVSTNGGPNLQLRRPSPPRNLRVVVSQ